MTAMHPADQLRALTAAEKFLRTQMTTVALVAILRYQGGSVDILQDFTADRNKLLSIIETMIVGEGQGSAESVDDASSADTGAAFGQDDSEFNVFNTDLSSQRVDLKDALFNAEKTKNRTKEEDVNPLVQNGQKLIPSVTRVFRQNQNMYVYLQAYEQGVAAAQPLVAFVSFYREQTKTFETQPMEMTTGLNSRLQTMPFSFSIPMSQVPPGEYDCQISVLDPTGKKAAFWQAQVKVIP